MKSCPKNILISILPDLTNSSFWVSDGSGKKNRRNNKHKLNNSNVNNDIENCFLLLDDNSSQNNTIVNVENCVLTDHLNTIILSSAI